jgi:hypothetical protein
MMTSNVFHHPSSYRDPSGFIFEKEGTLYRQVNISFKEQFDHFIQSGCYKHLTERGLLIAHEQLHQNLTGDANYYTTLKPEVVPFISYPYEWSFDMLKDAALLTLQLVRESLQFGIILKDATPYNIQWFRGRLIFIDTLSFEKYEERPWIAYRQFCETFLGPLLLMHYSKQSLQQLFLAWPDGIPLSIIKSLLPKRSRFSIHTYLHIHLHSKISGKKQTAPATPVIFSKEKLLRLILSLETLINSLKLPSQQGVWSDYYEEAGGRKDYLEQKKKIISAWLDQLPGAVADLGANEGTFSILAAAKDEQVIAADFDPWCINKLYNDIKTTNQKNIQPLILDLSNPSPANGVNNEERSSFTSRTNVDTVLALALIHHLAIGKNIPFEKIAKMFWQLGKNLIIEFVPKEDEKVQLMLSQKKDIYDGYNEASFKSAFSRYFTITESRQVPDSVRALYRMSANK